MTISTRSVRPLAAGLVVALLGACTSTADKPYYLPMTIEPGAGPEGTTGNEALILNSSVLVGDLLVGGIAAGRLTREGDIEPAQALS